ncbi:MULTISPECIES: RbsD/FucU domain-containing protein [Gimesia]|uniref:Fucose isomerase n=2 Tax=Gimesia TaxID=1649453 RepID=A0A6I6A9C1_9PLAN|nr:MULTISPECIES: RbsD/FucU domain-containing protein [Gimesia]QDU01576.1 L-fucose mutarotase [Gimesia chilikensis]QGQ22636.1 fucose isomerase [Gimesia benthica]
MLNGIPPIISPDLMYVLMKMGHGDDIVLADGNFPADSHAQRIIRLDGHGVPEILSALLPFFPLDTFVDQPAGLMNPVDDQAAEPPIWQTYRELIHQYDDRAPELEKIERFEFYERARQAYAIIATSETALYANLILKKGVVVE